MLERNQSPTLGTLLSERLEVYHLPHLRQRSPKVKVRDLDKDQVDLDDKTPMVPMANRTDQHEEEGQIPTKLRRLKMDLKLLGDQGGIIGKNKLLLRLRQRKMLLSERDSRSLLPLDLWRIPRVMIRRMRVRMLVSVYPRLRSRPVAWHKVRDCMCSSAVMARHGMQVKIDSRTGQRVTILFGHIWDVFAFADLRLLGWTSRAVDLQ
jgi:hypothetical protein